MLEARILSTTSGICALDEKTALIYSFSWDKKTVYSLQTAESVDASTACYSHISGLAFSVHK
jgi:hypothetical protein